MAILGIDDFKSKLTGGGARANMFKATINFPSFAQGDVELTSFMCKQISIPASTIGAVEVAFRGRKFQIAGDRTFENVGLTIINDVDFAVRNAFERWMNGINGHESNTGIASVTDYSSDIIIEQLDKSGATVKTYNMRGCWPVSVAAIDLNYDSSDTIEEFAVDLACTYWDSDTTS